MFPIHSIDVIRVKSSGIWYVLYRGCRSPMYTRRFRGPQTRPDECESNQKFYFDIYEREFLFDKARARARARVMLRVQIGTGCDYIFVSGTGARFD